MDSGREGEDMSKELHPAGMSFRYPMDTTDTPYLRYGQPYGSGRFKGIPHPGVDFLGEQDAPVYAIGNGRVIWDRFDRNGYGHYRMIAHRLITGEQVYSLYAHLQLHSVDWAGVWVVRGEVIGYQGATGAAGRPHLHFECKRSDELALYSKLNYSTLNVYFYDPYTLLDIARFDPGWDGEDT